MAKVRSSSARLSSVRAHTSSARKRSRSRWRCPVLLLAVAIDRLPSAQQGPTFPTGSIPSRSFLQDLFQGVLRLPIPALDGVPVDTDQLGCLIITSVAEIE